jgi:hypothetical protein
MRHEWALDYRQQQRMQERSTMTLLVSDSRLERKSVSNSEQCTPLLPQRHSRTTQNKVRVLGDRASCSASKANPVAASLMKSAGSPSGGQCLLREEAVHIRLLDPECVLSHEL